MRKIFFLILLLIPSLFLFATHNRAGEITYTHLTGLTYQFTITTYTYTPSPADRPEIDVYWGDGSYSTITRTSKVSVGEDISRNTYISTHTYASIGTYSITFEDPNRNAGVVNIPNSVEVPFFIETILVINPFLGGNSSPILLNAPIDNGCTNVTYYHNPGAYDPDGDSLSYDLIDCRGYDGEAIPGFTYPQASNSITIDPYNGDLIWDTPLIVGEYNIAILITEWRNGIMIGSVTRDMQITIAACNNQPPVISVIEDTCVLAGTNLRLDVVVTDPNSSQVYLTATGLPFLVSSSPAQLLYANGAPPDSSLFYWNTNCSHIKKDYYSVLFKATDNGPIIELSSFKTLRIKIIAPKPENLVATPVGNNIHLSWNREYCSNAVGYDIYRRTNSNPFEPDYCETGMPEEEGYVYLSSTYSISDTTFVDDGTILPLYHGNEYCYRIVATFADGAESYVSDEVCNYLFNDAPLMTHVDITKTHIDTGEIFLSWAPPTEMDSLAFPGPQYEYHIYKKGVDDTGFQLLASTNSLLDTQFVDSQINTVSGESAYYVELWGETLTGMQKMETADKATSIFLSIAPADKSLHLSWTVTTPWQNIEYTIFRYNTLSQQFDSIDVTTESFYLDLNLLNGIHYRYFVRSEGGYFVPDTIFPLFNRSQIVEAVPIDNIPPELPNVSITTDCKNVLIDWWFDNDSLSQDVFTYYIYYRPDYNTPYSVFDSITNNGNPCYPEHCYLTLSSLDFITGCFAMAAIDSVGNLSELTEESCFDFDDCMSYSLPNIFTPNGDNYNDLFKPFPYANVQKIDLHIYNRWGKLVFKTEDPDINWNGCEYHSGAELPNGNYYYVCEVYVYTLSGIVTKPLHGTVILTR